MLEEASTLSPHRLRICGCEPRGKRAVLIKGSTRTPRRDPWSTHRHETRLAWSFRISCEFGNCSSCFQECCYSNRHEVAKSPRTSCFASLRTESGLISWARAGKRHRLQQASIRSRRSRTRVDTVEKRVERAEALISMGEISAARRALELVSGRTRQRGRSGRIEG